jgi:hypothetical protein
MKRCMHVAEAAMAMAALGFTYSSFGVRGRGASCKLSRSGLKLLGHILGRGIRPAGNADRAHWDLGQFTVAEVNIPRDSCPFAGR